MISELRKAGREQLATGLKELVKIVTTRCENIKNLYQTGWDDDELREMENKNFNPLEGIVTACNQCAKGIDDVFKAVADYSKDAKANAKEATSTLNVIEVLQSAKGFEGEDSVDAVRKALEKYTEQVEKLETNEVVSVEEPLKTLKDSIGNLKHVLSGNNITGDLESLVNELENQCDRIVKRHEKFVDGNSCIAAMKNQLIIQQINNARAQIMVPVSVKVPEGFAGEFELVSKIVSSKNDIGTNLDKATDLLNRLPSLLLNRQLPEDLAKPYKEAQDALNEFQSEYNKTIASGNGYIINEQILNNMLNKFSSLSNALYAPEIQGQEYLLAQEAENLDRLNVNLLNGCISFSENVDGIRKYVSLHEEIKSARTEVVNQGIPVLRRKVDVMLATLGEVTDAFKHLSNDQEELIGEVRNAIVEFMGDVAKVESGERDIVVEPLNVENVKGSIAKLAEMLNAVNKELGDKLKSQADGVLRDHATLMEAVKSVLDKMNTGIWSEVASVSARMEDLNKFNGKVSFEKQKWEGDVAQILNDDRPDTLSMEMLEQIFHGAEIVLSQDQRNDLFVSTAARRSLFNQFIEGRKLDGFSWVDLMYVLTDKLNMRLDTNELHKLHRSFDRLTTKRDQEELTGETLVDKFRTLRIELQKDEMDKLQQRFKDIASSMDDISMDNAINDVFVHILSYGKGVGSCAWRGLEKAIELRHEQVGSIRSILTEHQEDNETFNSLLEMLDMYEMRTSELENIRDTISGYTGNYFNALEKIDQLSESMTEINKRWKPNTAQRQIIATVNDKLKVLKDNIRNSEKNVWDYKDDVDDVRIKLRDERFPEALDYLMCTEEVVKFNSELIKDVQTEILRLAGAMRDSGKEKVIQDAKVLTDDMKNLMKIHKNLGENVKGRLNMKTQSFVAQMDNDRRQMHGKKDAFTNYFGQSIGILNGAAGNPPVQEMNFARMETALEAFQKLDRGLKQLQNTGKLQLEDGAVVDFSNESANPSFRQALTQLEAQRITSYKWLLQISEAGRNVGLHDELPNKGAQESEIKKALRKSIPVATIATAIAMDVPLASLDEICIDSNESKAPVSISSFQGVNVNALNCTYGKGDKTVEKVFMDVDTAPKHIAWQNLAQSLGCGDIVPKLKPSYGMHKGDFGVFFDNVKPAVVNNQKMQLLVRLAGLDDSNGNVLTRRIQITNDGMLQIPYTLQDNDFASQDEFNDYLAACKRCSDFKDSLNKINIHSSDNANYIFDLNKMSRNELMNLQSLIGWPLVAIAENMDEKMAAALMKIAANPAKIAKLKGNLPSDAKANNEFFEQRLNLMIGQARMMLERQKLEAYIANKRDDARLYGTV
ncbi:MAG: hypothetical protein MJ202_01970 [Lentisphaeria bacterium]|nr:hypothetical protein [Lentisphaeria bacterium]